MESPKKEDSLSSALEKKVRQYYDDNTKMFLKLGADARTKSIHQPLFLDNAYTLTRAMHAQHDMILATLNASNTNTHVLDLGCGVGASMIYLAHNTPANVRFTGITLSPKQAVIGIREIGVHGFEDRIRIVAGSFQEIPATVQQADLAFAIESLIHSPDAAIFFQQVAGRLHPGGKLLVFDDFLNHPADTRNARHILSNFRCGWKANSILTVQQVTEHAATVGLDLEEDMDFTPTLRLNRLRDILVRCIVPLSHLLAPFSSYHTFLIGGDARQRAFNKGLLSYRKMEFRLRE